MPSRPPPLPHLRTRPPPPPSVTIPLLARRPDSGELPAAHGGVDRRGLTQRPPSFLLQPTVSSSPSNPIHFSPPPPTPTTFSHSQTSKNHVSSSIPQCFVVFFTVPHSPTLFSFVFPASLAANVGGWGEIKPFFRLFELFLLCKADFSPLFLLGFSVFAHRRNWPFSGEFRRFRRRQRRTATVKVSFTSCCSLSHYSSPLCFLISLFFWCSVRPTSLSGHFPAIPTATRRFPARRDGYELWWDSFLYLTNSVSVIPTNCERFGVGFWV